MTRRKILLVDGDDVFRREMTSALNAHGFETIQGTTSGDALDLAASARPSVIVVSVELGPSNGWLVCTRLKKDAVLHKIPVVLVSATATPEIIERHKKLRTRADDYLRKPFSVEELVRSVSQLAPASAEEDVAEISAATSATPAQAEAATPDEELPAPGSSPTYPDGELRRLAAPLGGLPAAVLDQSLHGPPPPDSAVDGARAGDELLQPPAPPTSVGATAGVDQAAVSAESAADDSAYDVVESDLNAEEQALLYDLGLEDLPEPAEGERGVEGADLASPRNASAVLEAEPAVRVEPVAVATPGPVASGRAATEAVSAPPLPLPPPSVEPAAVTPSAQDSEPLPESNSSAYRIHEAARLKELDRLQQEIVERDRELATLRREREEAIRRPREGEEPAVRRDTASRDAVDELNERVKSLQDIIESREASAAGLESRILELESDLEGYRQTEVDRDVETQRLRSMFARENQEAIDLRKVVIERDRAIEALRTSELSLQVDVAKARDENMRRDAALKSMTAKAEKLVERSLRLESERTALREEARVAGKDASQLREQVDQLSSELKQSVAHGAALEAEVEALRAENTSAAHAGADTSELQAQLEEVKTAKAALEGDLVVAKTELDDLWADFDRQHADAQKAQAEYTDLADRLAAAEGRATRATATLLNAEVAIGRARDAFTKVVGDLALAHEAPPV